MKKYLLLPVAALTFIAACNNQPQPAAENKPAEVSPSDKELLENAKAMFPVLAAVENPDNKVTPEKVALGKMLYYDTRLSKTGNNSCNSCHNLNTFGVDNLPTSKGDNGKFGTRNSPTSLNAATHEFQFWDGRAKNVEEQAGMPILNPAEMAMPSKDFVVKKLKGITQYQDMFKAAFPEEKDALTYANLEKAIGAFERTLITPSAFDKFLGGDANALTAEEKDGLKQFMSVGCNSCHMGANLGGNMFQKFGVYADYRTLTHSTIADNGKKDLTKQDLDKDMFKVPGMRNVAKTAPYFHDGSVADLKEAVKIMGKLQLNKDLSDAQVNAITAFLGSLTADVPADVKQMPEALAQK